MHPFFRTGIAAAALLAMPLAQAAPNTFDDPLDVPAPASAAAARDMLVGGERTPGGRLVVIGRRGVVLTSDSGGAKWTQSKVPVSTDLLAASFPTAMQGWAVGHAGVVLHTGDGGLSWTRQVDGRALPDLMIGHSKARAEAGDKRAQDQLKEAQRYKEDGPSRPLFDVHFIDEMQGIVVGAYNLALRTDNGGRSWLPISDRIDNPQGLHLYGIAQVDGVLWIAGEQGLVLRQDAASGRFVRVPLPYAGTLFGITGRAGEVLVFGLRGNAWRSRDGGANWSRLDTGTEGHLTAGAILADGRVVLASLAGELIESADGARFSKVPLARPAPLYGVSPASGGTLLLTGARGVRVASLAPSAAVRHNPALAARAGKPASGEAR